MYSLPYIIPPTQLDTVILNSRNGAVWQNQVNPSVFQFPPNTAITEVVEVTATGYDIAINGNHYTFNHRMDVALVDRISTTQVNQLSIGKVTMHQGLYQVGGGGGHCRELSTAKGSYFGFFKMLDAHFMDHAHTRKNHTTA